MNADTAEPSTDQYYRWLPFWAVYQADLRQTLRGWIYRAWLFLTLAAVVGYVLYSFGAKQETGRVMPAHHMISEILRWTLWGSVTMIIVLSAGTICSEQGELADSILCRGISRHQYFLGKWTARLSAVLGTYFLLGGFSILASFLLLHGENLSLPGCFLGLATVASLLILVVTIGVSVSAIVDNTVLSIALVWVGLYGIGFLFNWLPESYPSPERTLKHLPNILRGYYDLYTLSRLISGALTFSLLAALFSMFAFSRKDV